VSDEPINGARLDGGASCSPVPSVSVAFPLDEVYEASNGILDHLEDSQLPLGLGVFALVLTLGRVLAPVEMTPEEEQKFLTNVLDFIGANFASGRAN
jgi:hypothetical protein